MTDNNLDLLLGEPIEATFGGVTYKLPSDSPIPLVLKTQRLGELIESDDGTARAKAIEDLYDEVLTLVRVHQPDADSVALSLPQLVAFFPVVYGGATLSDDTEQAGPTRAKRTSGRPKTSGRSTRSRSSAR